MRKFALLLGLVTAFLVGCEASDVAENDEKIEEYSTGHNEVGDPDQDEDEEY